LSGEALQIAVKRREGKSKEEKERYKHLNAECSLVLLEEGVCYEVQFQTPPKHSFTHRRMMTSFSSSRSQGSLDSAVVLLLLSHFSRVRHCVTP